ncbi:MAG: NAD-dependent epimerase/dehydratase family protein [Hyphomicrobiaceae bacterium]|nr:NAD-dependent epimerase/dehydratase family protein [Hyphomicrobiaceae bacterium]
MSRQAVILGYGAVGRAAAEALQRTGWQVRIAQRSQPADLAPGAAFQAADILDAEAVRSAVEGAGLVVMAVGLPYSGKVWTSSWPRAMHTVVEAVAGAGARLVFADNLYMYGPQTRPLTEDMALTDFGTKPAVRAEVTRIWRTAHEAGRIRATALRAPDFYGPGVTLSHIGETGLKVVARGKPAFLLIDPDMPHAFAYVPDIGRAIATLAAAPDDAYGEAWHVPCAPISTPRALLEIGARCLGRRLRLFSLPPWALTAGGLVSPFLREVAEMRFTFDRPYEVDATKFARRFWGDATPGRVGAEATARSFAAAPA